MSFSDFDVLEITRMLKALSDPLRLSILRELKDGEKSVTSIVKTLKASQANISKHLQVLQSVHLVKSRRAGTTKYYSYFDDCIHELCVVICTQYQKIIEKKYLRKSEKEKSTPSRLRKKTR